MNDWIIGEPMNTKLNRQKKSIQKPFIIGLQFQYGAVDSGWSGIPTTH